LIRVDVADMKVSRSGDDTLVTHSLGSCIGVAVYDPVSCVGGLLHFMLPSSSTSPEKAKLKPAMFADTGLVRLFKECYKLGAKKERMVVKVAGGAQVLDSNSVFNIGKRNYVVLRKILWRNGVLIKSEHVGGTSPRTLYLELRTGRVWVKVTGDGEVEL